jgi:hypothetical protein
MRLWRGDRRAARGEPFNEVERSFFAAGEVDPGNISNAGPPLAAPPAPPGTWRVRVPMIAAVVGFVVIVAALVVPGVTASRINADAPAVPVAAGKTSEGDKTSDRRVKRGHKRRAAQRKVVSPRPRSDGPSGRTPADRVIPAPTLR